MTEFHPLVKRLLDGEATLADLPPELREQGAAALRLLGAIDRTPVTLDPALDARVMAAIGQRGRTGQSPASRRALRWLSEPRELRLRVRPWVLGVGLAAAAGLVAALVGPRAPQAPGPTVPESAFVSFVLYAPGATQVALAGTFNHWDQAATPLRRAAAGDVWTVTLALPAGEHQYAFVVDHRRWVTDPAAPAVDDGFGRRNSVIAVGGPGGHRL